MESQCRTVIAIPVKNEEDFIGGCLEALMPQAGHFDNVVLLLNNCTDRSLRICQEFKAFSTKLEIIEKSLHGEKACAGEARRLALEHALDRAGRGIVLTTDADAIPGPNWVADNVAELNRGADAVCGMAALFPDDCSQIPPSLGLDSAAEALLLELLDEIAALVDPDLADPWPRHQQHSGASIAVRAEVLRKAGGAPRVACGEDRALIERLRLVDARIRHSPGITVQVSGRLEGRAAGGMAETIARRLRRRDELTDESLEPAVDAFRRVVSKARLRALKRNRTSARSLANDLLVSPAAMQQALDAPYFGAAWAAIERLSPVLHRRRVPFAGLHREIRQASALLGQLRSEATYAIPAGPAFCQSPAATDIEIAS